VATAIYPQGGVNLGPRAWLMACVAGMALGIITLAFNRIGNFSIYPTPKPGGVLVTGGPYRWIRHPMYTALMLMMVGIAGYNGHWLNAAGAALVAAVVVTKARVEEQLMAASFDGYERVASRRTCASLGDPTEVEAALENALALEHSAWVRWTLTVG